MFKCVTAPLVFIAMCNLAACGSEAPSNTVSQPAGAAGPLEGEVNIVAWPGYIERGETDKKFDWVTEFEQSSGCKVNVKTANTSDEMVALMNEGGFDLVTASGDASLRLIAGGKVRSIDVGRIQSWNNVDDRFKMAPWHTVDGVHYGTPYLWGPNILMYRTDVFSIAPKSWSVVFVETELDDGKSNSGRVQAYDGAIHIADAAMYLMYHSPELGIKSPYELNEKQYQAALDLLRQQRKLVSRYWHDSSIQIDDFMNEGVVASGAWAFQANILKGEGQPVATTFPIEGVTGWADTTMMHVDAANPSCSYKWMEHSLSKKVQGDLAAWFGGNPVVPEACNGNPLLGEDGCKNNGFEQFDKVHFWRTPASTCATQKQCIPYYRWVSDYIAVIGGR